MNIVLVEKYKRFHYAILVGCFFMPPIGVEGAESTQAQIKAMEKELGEMRAMMREQIRQMAEKKKELAELRALIEQQASQTASKEQVQALREEVEVTRGEQAEWKSYDSTVHLAGYGAVGFADNDPENDRFNQVQFNPVFHYQYKDLIFLEAELELEIGEDGETEVGLEYANVDVFLNDYMMVVAGKFLSPLGQFQQNLHPTWINKLPSRPPGFGEGQAAPSADVGAELRGGFPVGKRVYANYAIYVGNGPELELSEDGDEIEAVETEGFVRDRDDNKIFGGRLGFLPIPQVEIGVSGAVSDVALDGEPDRDYDILGFDFFGRWRNLDVRAEYLRQRVGSQAASVAPERQEWEAWYTQASYKLLPTKFEAVVRYTDYDPTLAEQRQKQWALGLNYLFASHAMAKFAYEFNDGLSGEPADEDTLLLQLTYGF